MKVGTGTELLVEKIPRESALIREISKTRFEKADVLDEMRRHLEELETLHSRLMFMMGEIQGLVRRH